MKRCYVLFLSLLLWSYCVQAQHWGKSYVQHSRSIYSIVINAPDNISVSGGNDYNASLEAIFHSTDFGLNWPENPADSFGFCVRSIAFSDPMHGFGTGFFGNYVHTTDGGNTWPRDVLPVNRNFFKAIYATPSTAFLAGGQEQGSNMQTILKSTNSASSWTIVRDTAGPVLRSIYFIDSLRGVAAGDSGTILRTADGGSTWTAVTSPVQFNLNSISFINADTGYIIGGWQYTNASKGILRTVDGGITWSIQLNQPGPWFADIFFLNKDTGYLVGDSATLWQSIDGGQSWSPQTVTNANGSESFTSVRFYNSGFGVIGSLNGAGVFVYADPPTPLVQTGNVVFAVYNSQPTIDLTGSTNTQGSPANISFIIGTDSLFTSFFETPYPQTITSTSMVFSAYDISSFLGAGTYYFTCKVANTGGAYYGDTVRFTMPVTPAVLTALPYTNAGITSLTMQGQVSEMPIGSNVYFEYSILGDSVIHAVAATPSQITDTLTHNVSASIASIIPGISYHYRVMATIGAEILYSDYQSFTLGSGSVAISVLPAANITVNSATLQGQVLGLTPTSTIWFEYIQNGVTTTVAAVPPTVADNLMHTVSAQLTGLLPDSLYQYRLKVNYDTFGTIYSTYSSFYTYDMSSLILSADSSILSTTTSAAVYGHVSHLHFPAQVQFSYWTNGSSILSATASPSFINDSATHIVSAVLNGLLPNKIYNYNISLSDSLVTLQTSNTLQFYTGTTHVVTLPVSDLTATSATLNGMMQQEVASLTNLSFEYGTTLAFGSSIAATPATVSDTTQHNVTATVTGFQNNLLYYCRLKASNNSGIVFGDTIQIYTGTSEIPNWDFQIWNSDTVPLLPQWLITTSHFARVPGHSGNYALMMSGQNIASLGAVSFGGNGVTFAQGYPYNYRPDSLSAWMNFNLPPGDSAALLVNLQHQGVPLLPQPWCKVGGSTGGVFKRFAFKMYNPSGLTPDTMNIVIIVGGKTDTITIDDLQFTGAGAPPIHDGDFETWYDYPYQDLVSWDYLKFISLDSFPPYTGYHPVTRDYFNAPDDYAARIENIQLGGFLPGSIGTSEGYLGSPAPSFAVNGRHNTLNGYFKFYPVAGDSMVIQVGMNKNGQWIGIGTFTYGDSVTDFRPFSVPISYYNGLIPDSGSIGITAYKDGPHGHSILIIDKLHFDGLLSGIGNEASDKSSFDRNGIKIYPNPSNSQIYIELTSVNGGETEFEVTNMSGRIISSHQNAVGRKFSVDIADLPSGVYVVTAKSNSQSVSSRFVKY